MDTDSARFGRVLDALKRHRAVSDDWIAERTGLARASVSRRRSGDRTITLDDADRIAKALAVPVSVWFMEPDEAVSAVIDHDRDKGQAFQKQGPTLPALVATPSELW